MSSLWPYSRDLMTTVIEGLEPSVYPFPDESPTSNWGEEVCESVLSFRESSAILSRVVDAFDREPVGWFPPRYPLSLPRAIQELHPKSSPAIYVPLNLVNDDGYPYTDDVDSSSQSSNSTPPSSVSSPSPSPSPSRHTRSPSKGPMPRASNEKRSPELSPIQALRGKGRERIRQSSGVKSKAKTPQMHGPQNVCATPSPTTTLEMVQCGWGGCTKRLHVDYVSVKHWGNHVREHYIRQQEMIECKWNGGCGARINKSSVWKHIVVHQPKFKLRCPRGCEVFTRGDMMKRHLRTCPFTPSGATTEESDEEGGMQSGEVPHVIDYDGGSEESE